MPHPSLRAQQFSASVQHQVPPVQVSVGSIPSSQRAVFPALTPKGFHVELTVATTPAAGSPNIVPGYRWYFLTPAPTNTLRPRLSIPVALSCDHAVQLGAVAALPVAISVRDPRHAPPELLSAIGWDEAGLDAWKRHPDASVRNQWHSISLPQSVPGTLEVIVCDPPPRRPFAGAAPQVHSAMLASIADFVPFHDLVPAAPPADVPPDAGATAFCLFLGQLPTAISRERLFFVVRSCTGVAPVVLRMTGPSSALVYWSNALQLRDSRELLSDRVVFDRHGVWHAVRNDSVARVVAAYDPRNCDPSGPKQALVAEVQYGRHVAQGAGDHVSRSRVRRERRKRAAKRRDGTPPTTIPEALS